MTYKRLTAISGLIAWVMVGLPAFIYHTGRPGWSWGWVAAFIVFGCAFAADLARPRPELLLADHAAPVVYEIPLPPKAADEQRRGGAASYIHAPRGRKSRAIDTETERFVEDSRMKTAP